MLSAGLAVSLNSLNSLSSLSSLNSTMAEMLIKGEIIYCLLPQDAERLVSVASYPPVSELARLVIGHEPVEHLYTANIDSVGGVQNQHS